VLDRWADCEALQKRTEQPRVGAKGAAGEEKMAIMSPPGWTASAETMASVVLRGRSVSTAHRASVPALAREVLLQFGALDCSPSHAACCSWSAAA
jgi:hypothetical protein